MKKTILLALAALLVGVAQAGTSYYSGAQSAPAYTTSGGSSAGFYLDLTGGALWLDELEGLDFDTGWGVNGEFGYNFGNGWSLGVNSGFYNSEFDHRWRGLGVNGEIDIVPIMANITYRHQIAGGLSAYIGVGGGVIYQDGEATLRIGSLSATVGEDEWDGAFQARAGLSFEICPVSALTVGYRYLHGFNEGDDLSGHVLEGGLIIRF